MSAIKYADKETIVGERNVKAHSHDPISRIHFLVVPKIGSCEHGENDFLTQGSVILKKRMEVGPALFSLDTLFER